MSFFLTGTDTGVGKTFCAIHLLRLGREAGLRCAGMKPICCGDRGDAERLLAASSDGLTIDELNPVWLKTPVAPFAATLIERTIVDLNAILDGYADLTRRFDCVVVEGVGGWLVPIRAVFCQRSRLCVEFASGRRRREPAGSSESHRSDRAQHRITRCQVCRNCLKRSRHAWPPTPPRQRTEIFCAGRSQCRSSRRSAKNRLKSPLIGDRCMPGNRTQPCQSQEHKCISSIH